MCGFTHYNVLLVTPATVQYTTYITSLLDLTDGKYFVAMEWSMVLERHPLDLMEWRCFYGLMITKQLLVLMEGQCVLERQPWESME